MKIAMHKQLSELWVDEMLNVPYSKANSWRVIANKIAKANGVSFKTRRFVQEDGEVRLFITRTA